MLSVYTLWRLQAILSIAAIDMSSLPFCCECTAFPVNGN